MRSDLRETTCLIASRDRSQFEDKEGNELKYTGTKAKHARRRMIVSTIVATAAFSLVGLGWNAAPGAAAEARPEITTPLIQELQAQLAALVDRTDLSETEKEKLAGIYRDALNARRRAEEYRLKSEYVGRLLAEAPDKRAALQAALDAPLPVEDGSAAAEDATLAEITARVTQLEADLATQRDVRAKLDGEVTHRAERRITLPREASEAKLRADGLRETLATLPVSGSETDGALRARTEAQIAENEAKAALHSKELASYDGRRELLATRRDLAALRVSRLETDLASSRQALVAQREFAGQEASRVADDARAAAAAVHPALQELAAEVAQLAEERVIDGGLSARLTHLEEQLAAARAAGPALHKRFEGIRSKAAVVGYTDAIGALLRKEKTALPSSHPHAGARRQAEIADTQLRMIELEEARRKVASITPAAEAILATIDGDAAPIDRVAIKESARQLVSQKRDYLDSLIDDYDKYFLALIELDNAEKELMQEASRYERYIDEHVLWIRSAKALSPLAIPNAVEAALWLVSPLAWAEVVASLYRTATQRPVLLGLALAPLGLLFYFQSRLRRFVRDTGARTRNVRDERTFDAIAILGATFLLAFVWPALMNVASYVMIAGRDERGSDLVVALATALSQVAAVFLTFEFLRQLCRVGGLAESHLGWSRARIEAIRLHSNWALPAGLLALLVALVLQNHSDADWQGSLGRTAFIASMIVLTLFANRVLLPTVQPLPSKTPALPTLSGHIATSPAWWLSAVPLY
jgi:potassium efflux system protein